MRIGVSSPLLPMLNVNALLSVMCMMFVMFISEKESNISTVFFRATSRRYVVRLRIIFQARELFRDFHKCSLLMLHDGIVCAKREGSGWAWGEVRRIPHFLNSFLMCSRVLYFVVRAATSSPTPSLKLFQLSINEKVWLSFILLHGFTELYAEYLHFHFARVTANAVAARLRVTCEKSFEIMSRINLPFEDTIHSWWHSFANINSH